LQGPEKSVWQGQFIEPGPGPEGRQLLVFKVGEYSLALPLNVLRKVYDAQGLPPRSPGSRVLDMYQITGASAGASPGYWIEMEVGERRYLMPVESVEEIRELSLAVPLDYPDALRREETSFVKSLYFDGLRMIAEISPEELAHMTEGIKSPRKKHRERRGVSSQRDENGEPPEGKLVVFESGDGMYAVPLDLVRQIMDSDEIHPVPAAGQKIRGLVYHAETGVPVMSQKLLDGKGPDEGGTGMIIVVESGKGPVGFACRRVVKLAEAEEIEWKGEEEGAIKLIRPERILEKLL